MIGTLVLIAYLLFRPSQHEQAHAGSQPRNVLVREMDTPATDLPHDDINGDGLSLPETPEETPRTATIAGAAMLIGPAPPATVVDMSEEPTCLDQYRAAPTDESILRARNGELANVFVYVKQGLPARDWEVPAQPAVLDQRGCRFIPRVLAIQAGQRLIIRNSDGILHNINTRATINQGFNISQPVEMETERFFSENEIMMPVECAIHAWMRGYINVADHPYMTVTGQNGDFTLPDLPPGKYEIEAMHERYGTRTKTVQVGPGELRQISFEF